MSLFFSRESVLFAFVFDVVLVQKKDETTLHVPTL